MPASTTKHVVVDDNDSSESINTSGRSDSANTGDTEDEIGDDDGGQPGTEDGTEERGVRGTPNSFSFSMNTRWTVSRSELYSIKAVRSVDVFEKSSDQGPIYKGQMFKDKPTLKRAVGSYAFAERFEYRVSRSFNTRFTAECTQKSCGWVLQAWKSNRGTYRHVKSFVNEHTCDLNDNCNIEFKRVSAYVIGNLFASKFGDPGHRICPKDIVFKMREQHGIHLSYNKDYRSKEHALNQVFGNPWEYFQRLPAHFYVLEQSNPGTVTKIKSDSKNRFKYGFMAIGASIEGFNSIIRPVICIDASHLKARVRGVLLVAVCKDGNEMIYPLAFGFANSECTESAIFNAMEAIFLDASHGICAYHLAQNLKRFCKQRDDVIWLYYCATYAYRIDEFDRAMAELKETYLMAEFIRDLLQRWFYNRRKNASEMSTYLTTFAYEHIKDRTETAHRCEIHLIHFNTFKADDKWKETTVDLDERSCSCRQWDLDELSCSHAVAVARFKGVSINALASKFYTTGFLKHAYEMSVNPVPDPEYWDIPDAIRTLTLLPWKKKNLPGRPKKLRIPSAGEKESYNLVQSVEKKGHNKITCPEPSSSTCKPAKKTRTCSIYKKEGHNRLKCPDKPPEPTLID
ncbi:hypothetical protein Dsin_002039 [Dipteronia sinensis]|uniref:SWIM-type domain-containing protein n=1 Tax=Dipteronia sinensis TaxID=43782 RepID=A0AAE0B531_9ROSI|nr:hypothetical protein Dsin_002039 [Dipteronia sinensis]